MNAFRSLNSLVPLCWAVLSAGLAVSALPGAARGEAAPPVAFGQPLSLAECLSLGAANVPTVQAFQARLAVAEAQLAQARTYPNPVANYFAQDIGVADATGKPLLLHQATLGWPFLSFYTRTLEATTARAQKGAVAAAVQEGQRQLRLLVGRGFFDLLLQEELADIEAQGSQAATELLTLTERRLAHGDVGGAELARARAEVLDARRNHMLALRRRDLDRFTYSIVLGAERPMAVLLQRGWPAVAQELAPLLDSIGRTGPAAASPPEGPPGAPAAGEALPEIADPLLARSLAERPDVRQALATLRQAELQQRLEQRRAVPLANLLVAGGVRVSKNGVGGVVSVSVPLPLLDRNQGPRLQARAQANGAQAELERVQRNARLEVATALLTWIQARAARGQLSQPLLQAREQVLVAMQRLFAEGSVGYLDVVMALRDVLMARRALAQDERDVAVAQWQLLCALGRC